MNHKTHLTRAHLTLIGASAGRPGFNACRLMQRPGLRADPDKQGHFTSLLVCDRAGSRLDWDRLQHPLALTRASTACGLHQAGLGCNPHQPELRLPCAMPGWVKALTTMYRPRARNRPGRGTLGAPLLASSSHD